MVVGIRLSGEEIEHKGPTIDAVLPIVQALDSEMELDYISVTAGTSAGLSGSTHIVPSMRFQTGYKAPIVTAIRACIQKPIFVAGWINQP